MTVLKLLFISRHNSFARNLFYSLASSMVGGYEFMCLFWIVTGFRYDVRICVKVMAAACAVLFTLMGAAIIVIETRKQRSLRAISDRCREHGYDDEYYFLVRKYMGEPFDDIKRLAYGSCLLEGGRCEECRELLREIDFKSLCAKDQEDYFNLFLYSAVLEDNDELAREIYRSCCHYLYRAAKRRHSGYVLHTLGMYFLQTGSLAESFRLLTIANAEDDDSLSCECEIGLGYVYLKSGDLVSAKEMCYTAAENAANRSQAERLKKLMISVEEAYRRAPVKPVPYWEQPLPALN